MKMAKKRFHLHQALTDSRRMLEEAGKTPEIAAEIMMVIEHQGLEVLAIENEIEIEVVVLVLLLSAPRFRS